MSKTFKLLMLLPAAALLFTGCLSRTPAAKMYVLPSAQAASVVPGQRGRIAFQLPAYLQRTEMRLFDAASGEIRPCKGGLWAAPLHELLSEALAGQLAGCTATVACASFAPDFNGEFHAGGRFTLKRADGTEVSGDFAFTLPPPEGLPRLSPAALARQYADAIRLLATQVNKTDD